MAKRQPQRRTTKGTGRKQTEILHRTFGDLEVADAEHDLRVPITATDVKRGKKGNPAECAIAQGCKRELGASAAVIYKTRAYVDVLGEDGVRRVERFLLSPAARAIVLAFDRGEPIPADGRWLVLAAPPPSQTLDADLRRERRRRAQVKKGTYTPSQRRSPSPKEAPRDLEVRNGTGHWQMILRGQVPA